MRQGVAAPLRVLEFFAGVGGFRGGLEGFPGEEAENGGFKVVWSNQFEPSTKRQHASDVYVARWGAQGHSNEDITKVLADPAKFNDILNARADVLVGGFPCQDYSVAKSASGATGIEGKKGVLWWSIHETLHRLGAAGQPVRHVILENVDRLLKSPTKCRGRDFAIILSSLAQLGYAVEWRVVNAADYGYPQRRRRVFIVAHHESTEAYASLAAAQFDCGHECGDAKAPFGRVLDAALPCVGTSDYSHFIVGLNPLQAQDDYDCQADGSSRFEDAGIMVGGMVTTLQTTAATGLDHLPRSLGDVVRGTDEDAISAGYFIDKDDLEKWQYLKGGKSFMRTSKSGHSYKYSEGAMSFPDPLNKPGRTIITAEGGSSPSRFKHVVEISDGRLRRLVPEELEEMNGFPRGFTALKGISDTKRAFFMGNALVTGVVNRIARALEQAAVTTSPL